MESDGISWMTVANTFVGTLPALGGVAVALFALFKKVNAVAKATDGLLDKRLQDATTTATLQGEASGVATEQARHAAEVSLSLGRRDDRKQPERRS